MFLQPELVVYVDPRRSQRDVPRDTCRVGAVQPEATAGSIGMRALREHPQQMPKSRSWGTFSGAYCRFRALRTLHGAPPPE